MTNAHPLIAGLREEIAEIASGLEPHGCEACADEIIGLLHERLGPVLEAGSLVRHHLVTGDRFEVAYAARQFDEAVKRAGRPGGENS